MIPYFTFPTFELGPLTIQIWGLLAALGFLIGAKTASIRLLRSGSDFALTSLLPGLMFFGLLGARLGYLIIYSDWLTDLNPLEILKINDGGLSFFGGLIAGVIYLYFKLKPLPPRDRKIIIDALAFGWPVGEGVARIGCFLVHDHPGLPTALPWGVLYPDGIIRHDLGLELAALLLLLAIGFALMERRQPQLVGTYLPLALIAYGLMRLFTDPLRIEPVTYWHQPAGVWLGGLTLIIGLTMWITNRRKIRKAGTIQADN